MIDLIGLLIIAYIGSFVGGVTIFLLIYLVDKYLFKNRAGIWLAKIRKQKRKEEVKMYEMSSKEEVKKEEIKIKKINPIKEKKSRVQAHESNLTKKEMDMLNDIITDFRDKINELIENQNLIIDRLNK